MTSSTTEPTADTSVHPWLQVTRTGSVQTVTLTNATQRNAMVPSLWRALGHVAAHTPDDVRVVVLRGEGRTFSAGLHRRLLTPEGIEGEDDMMAISARGGPHAERMIEEYQRGFTRWAELPAVVVAAVQGHAIGAGFQLALAADLRVVAEDVQLCMRETALGMVPDLGGTKPLVDLVGYARALEICATGRFVGAAEAQATGLANLVVPAERLEAATAEVVAGLLGAPDLALRELKPLLRNAVHASLADQTLLERQTNAGLLGAMARSVRGE